MTDGARATITELAGIVGINHTNLSKHIRNNALPRDAKKRYNIEDVKRVEKQDQAKDNRAKTKTPIQQQKVFLECKKLDRENKLAEGLLIEKAIVERRINELFAGLSKQLQALPGAISSRLVKKKRVQIQTILEETLRDICGQFADSAGSGEIAPEWIAPVLLVKENKKKAVKK